MLPGLLDSLLEPELRRFNDLQRAQANDPTFIPVHLTGGIGDVIISLDTVRWLHEKCTILVYCHHIEAFKYFCPDIPCQKILPKYTWKLEFNTIAKFHFTEDFAGFLIPEHAELFKQQRDVLNKDARLEALVRTLYNKFYLISIYARERGLSRRLFPMHSLGLNCSPEYKYFPKGEVDKIITIHDGYDVHNKYLVTGRATKQWKWEHWNQLVKMLKLKYPDYKIIQLGAVTGRVIDGIDECLLNKTTIIEAFDILKTSSLHIDGDSGLVHAAARFKIPTVVMWGPTPLHFYAYPQNINLTAKVCGEACYGVNDNWMDKCAIHYPAPKCMDEITPERVMNAIYEKDILCQSKNSDADKGGDQSPMLSTGTTFSSSTFSSLLGLNDRPI
jgi:hypothetical protein